MPIIQSAKKRVRTARRANIRNIKTKRSLKSASKDFQKSLGGDKKKAGETLNKVQSELDKASKKNVMHKNKVARLQRQLAKAAKAAGVKPVASKKSSPAVKKPVSKPASKKTTANKPAGKKTTTKK